MTEDQSSRGSSFRSFSMIEIWDVLGMCVFYFCWSRLVSCVLYSLVWLVKSMMGYVYVYIYKYACGDAEGRLPTPLMPKGAKMWMTMLSRDCTFG